ncbi:hypothetical protein chiPu_0024473, partial [Chiloscyllium punctatum]|nr:hypothetical protein [Chiloscyllium punctatum]
MLPFVSPVLLFSLCTLWVCRSPYDIIEKHPRIVYFLVGTAFSNLTCKLIVCQMSNTRCQPLSWFLLPLVVGVIFVISGILQDKEYHLLVILTTVITLAHIHYGVCV